MLPHTWNLKTKQMNITKQKQTHRYGEQKCIPIGRGMG